MPNLQSLVDYSNSIGCGSDTIDYLAQREEQKTGKPADWIAIRQQCRADAAAKDQAQRMEIQAQQFHNRLVGVGTGSAALVLVAVVVIFRKQIRLALERVFISSAAKAIVSKRDLEKYRKTITERIKEKADNSGD